MLSVVYVLYSLLSRYIFGPVEEEENIEERRVSLRTREEKRQEEQVEERRVSLRTREEKRQEEQVERDKNRKCVDELRYVGEEKEGTVSLDHDNQLRTCEDYTDRDSEVVEDGGKITEQQNEVEKGEESEFVNEKDDVIERTRGSHFILLEENDEENVMADIGVVSVTSKYKIEESPVVQRIPFTQIHWDAPENDGVDYSEMGPVIQKYESISHATQFGNSDIITANVATCLDNVRSSGEEEEENKVSVMRTRSQDSFELCVYDKKMSKDVYLEMTEAAGVGTHGHQFNSFLSDQFSSELDSQFNSSQRDQFNSDEQFHSCHGSHFNNNDSTDDQFNDDEFIGNHGNHVNGASALYDPFKEPPKAKITKYIPKVKVEPLMSDGEWNTFFENSMLTGRREAILDGLKKCYRTASHPYMLCCDLLITFGITHASGRSIFQRAALKQLQDWKNTVDRLPTLTDKLKALEVSYLCNHTHFEALYTVFELRITPIEEAVAFIQDKLTHKKKKYIKHMAFIVTELHLQAHFDTAEMLFPLLAMDKMMTIEAYLYSPELAAEFIGHLDFLLSPYSESLKTLLETLEDEFDFDEKSSQFQFTADQISTLIKRFLKKYKISQQTAPNLSESKTVSNLKNLLFCKYKKGRTEDWTQAIMDAVRNSEMLQSALLNELIKYGDLPYAATIIQNLQIKPSLIPLQIQSFIDSSDAKHSFLTPPDTYVFDKPDISWTTFLDVEEEEMKGPELTHPVADSAGFLSLPPSVQIIDVTNAVELEQCSKLLATFDIIGLDSEWRAVLDPTKAAPVALLQLSCNQCVFLLDIPELLHSTTEAQLEQFAKLAFGHRMVVGYSLDCDVLMIEETVPALGHTLSTSNMVDLTTAHKHITKEHNEERSAEIRTAINKGLPLPKHSQSQYTGLAKLCETVLSAPLDKTCQITDWVRRPLTTPQRQYAALDAFVLLSLYDKLTTRFHPVPLNELTAVLPSSSNIDGASDIFEAPKNEEPIASRSLKVVADVPLQGLGKKLRHIGVDCVILGDGQDLDYAAKISLMEGRIILSKDSNCERLAKLTDPGRVYCVHSKDAASQLAEIIEHFNLTVSDNDLFSRCAMCNCLDFVKITPDQAKEIKALFEHSNSTTSEFTAPVLRRRIEHMSMVKVTMAGVTQFGVKLLIHKVTDKKLNAVKEFWGCYDCGKMYWDGCHLKNFKDKHSL